MAPRADWRGVLGLGLLFFAFFPILFNAALMFTTATRGALALSIIPLISMVVGAILGVEALTARKTVGVAVAVLGVAIALVAGSTLAPDGAWRGDLLMLVGAFCFALYNVLSRPLVRRSGPVPFTTMAMGIGALCLVAISLARGGFWITAGFGAAQWFAMGYLGVVGSALTLEHRTNLRRPSARSLRPASTQSRPARRNGLVCRAPATAHPSRTLAEIGRPNPIPGTAAM